MTTVESPAARQLSTSARFAATLVGTTMIVLLAVASQLRPDPRGFGTHRQLGLYRCTFEWFVGRPCPSCGMTTSWAHTTHGELGLAMRANAGGTVLALVSAIVAPWLLVSACRGRWIGIEPTDQLVASVAVVIAGITLVDWLRRLGWW